MSTVVFIPVKDCATWLPRFLQAVGKLKGVSRVVFSYGRSRDQTLYIIKEWRKHTSHKVKIIQDPIMGGALSSAEIGKIYQDFQEIMRRGDETHALLLDSDIMVMPSYLITRFKSFDKDIISPYVWTLFRHPKMFYDEYCFRLNGYRFHPFDPPLNNGKLLKLDSVGTCMLVKREPFLEVPYHDPYPHMTFCNECREKGYEVWAHPKTEVKHIDLVQFGIFHEQLDVLKARARGETNILRYIDRTPHIRDDGTIVDSETLAQDMINAYVWGIVK